MQKAHSVSRRGVLAAGAGALALPAVAGIAAPARAAAPMAGPAVADHYRFKLGQFEVTTLNDGDCVPLTVTESATGESGELSGSIAPADALFVTEPVSISF